MRIVIGSLSLAVVFVLAGCGAKKQNAGPDPVPVQAEMVALQEVQPSWNYSGEIRPDTEVQLAFKESGYVASLHNVKGADGRVREVQVGDEVPAGTVLGRLRSSDYQASLNSAVGQQHAMQGALDASHAELERAKATQAKANLDFDRAQALYTAKAITRPDYDAAVEQHTAATAAVQAALRQIDAHQGELNAAQGQAMAARINLGDTSLTAPMPGVIVQKNVERGSLVSAGSTAFTLDDIRVVKVSFGVPDSMLGYMKIGTAVRVRVDPLSGRTLTGRITEVAASADRGSRVFNVEVTLPNPDRALKVGMIASIRIQRGDTQSVPVVPMTALMTANSGSTSYAIFTVTEHGGKQFAQLQNVRIGETFGKSVVIDEGLAPGQRVIVNRTNQLNDGSPIQVVN